MASSKPTPHDCKEDIDETQNDWKPALNDLVSCVQNMENTISQHQTILRRQKQEAAHKQRVMEAEVARLQQMVERMSKKYMQEKRRRHNLQKKQEALREFLSRFVANSAQFMEDLDSGLNPLRLELTDTDVSD